MATETPRSHLFEALIFDMDVVLINSEPLHEHAKRETLLEVGIMVPESLFASYTGRSDKAMIYEVAAGHGLNEQRGAEILICKHRITSPWNTRCVRFQGLSSLSNGQNLAIDSPWLHPRPAAIERQH